MCPEWPAPKRKVPQRPAAGNGITTLCSKILTAKKNEMSVAAVTYDSDFLTSIANIPLVRYTDRDARLIDHLSASLEKLGKPLHRFLFMGDSTMRMKGDALLDFLIGDSALYVPKNHSILHTSRNITNRQGQLIAVYDFIWNPFLLPERYLHVSNYSCCGSHQIKNMIRWVDGIKREYQLNSGNTIDARFPHLITGSLQIPNLTVFFNSRTLLAHRPDHHQTQIVQSQRIQTTQSEKPKREAKQASRKYTNKPQSRRLLLLKLRMLTHSACR
jgi:hypothetical protein